MGISKADRDMLAAKHAAATHPTAGTHAKTQEFMNLATKRLRDLLDELDDNDKRMIEAAAKIDELTAKNAQLANELETALATLAAIDEGEEVELVEVDEPASEPAHIGGGPDTIEDDKSAQAPK